MAVRGLTTIRSSYGPEETMNRFEAEIRARGMIEFPHIDHAAGAAAVGLSLRPARRVDSRVAFGRKLSEQSSIREDVALSICEIEQARLLTLKAADHMD